MFSIFEAVRWAPAVIAIGYQGEKEALPEAYQEREKPSNRRQLKKLAVEGGFDRRLK